MTIRCRCWWRKFWAGDTGWRYYRDTIRLFIERMHLMVFTVGYDWWWLATVVFWPAVLQWLREGWYGEILLYARVGRGEVPVPDLPYMPVPLMGKSLAYQAENASSCTVTRESTCSGGPIHYVIWWRTGVHCPLEGDYRRRMTYWRAGEEACHRGCLELLIPVWCSIHTLITWFRWLRASVPSADANYELWSCPGKVVFLPCLELYQWRDLMGSGRCYSFSVCVLW